MITAIARQNIITLAKGYGVYLETATPEELRETLIEAIYRDFDASASLGNDFGSAITTALTRNAAGLALAKVEIDPPEVTFRRWQEQWVALARGQQ